ncbi:MAG TPA: DUF998 domain-containing protein [Kofleriaceae bacterium]|nr:DUF998 domain-containing protein [Kofleriaceae bacterium]
MRSDRTSRLLACGVAASLVSVGLDLVCSALQPGYQYSHQTVSELSAIGTPTRPLWVGVMTLVYEPLMLLFALGLWRAAGARWRLRVPALLLVVISVVGLAWPPMHMRGEPTSLTDTLHIAWTAAFGLLSMTTMAIASGALGRSFRAFTLVSIAAILVAGAVTGSMSPPIPEGGATPWIGLVERVSVDGWALWIAVFAVALRRARQYRNDAVSPMSRILTQRSAWWRATAASTSGRS